jgi:protein involved in polysaccharide export with SLBB domain
MVAVSFSARSIRVRRTRLASCARFAFLIASLAALLPGGCALLRTEPAAAPQGSAFAWLTNWVSQPMDASGGFDVESLRPDPRPATVAPDDLLEITIWDLYEQGKPYTFPVRVSEKLKVEVPYLGEFPVADRSQAQIETSLVETYKTSEYLVNPRVLVRSLDPPTVKVRVNGAVQRAGYVELSRTDTSVYAALVSAGGVNKTAGTQIAVVRRSQPYAEAASSAVTGGASEAADRSSSKPTDSGSGTERSAQHANSVETLAVDSGAKPDYLVEFQMRRENSALVLGETKHTQAHLSPKELATHRNNGSAGPRGEPTTVFDVTNRGDREALRALQLADGDEVIVKAVVPPVRIGGVVERPGSYPLPAGRSVNVWQAIEMAGGVHVPDVPLNITLIHPATEGRPAGRKSLHVAEYGKHPLESPLVEPGDVLHVEPTAGGKIKRAVGDLWSIP